MDFLKNNKRFSFKSGDKFSWDMNFETDVIEKENEITTVYTFENGLRVTNIAKKHAKHGAYEWVNYIENTSDMPSEIISELWDCDCTFPIEHEENRKWVAKFPDVETATKVYAPSGSTWSTLEFYCDVDEFVSNKRVNHIWPGETKEYSTSNGRSSEKHAPFFNIHKNGKGYIFAIGWSGQWKCAVSRTNDTISFKSKVEDTYFRLMPGEKIRTSSIVILPYTASVVDSQNLWRRLVKEEFSPLGKGGVSADMPISLSLWGGLRSDKMIKRINIVAKNDIPVDHIWVDAGWYGSDTKDTTDEFEGDWGSHNGDWTVSPHIHPNGFKDVAKAAHDSGRKFLLWFEPERAIYTTPMCLKHPEYFLGSEFADDKYRILNLGDPAAWQYCYDMLEEKIREIGIDCLRIDFNPWSVLTYWQKNDPADRQGMTEIKYVNGLYELWDKLLEKFPHMLIDNCASGGRRIDIETLRRSVPLWRSDFQCPANCDTEGAQCHTQCFSSWMPYSATGPGRTCDEYRFRSAYCAGFNMGFNYGDVNDDVSPEIIDFMKKYVGEAVKVRPYFSEDYYPLTETSDRRDVWCANQFDRPSERDGMLQIFRRDRSPYETAVFELHGINPNSDYIFTDIDGGGFKISGKELNENGLEITVKEKRKAKIYFYKEI